MRDNMWRYWLVVAAALWLAVAQTPTLCEDEACHCDPFTRVICSCRGEDDTVMLRPDGTFSLPQMTTGIIVNNCARVQFLSETIRNLVHLRTVEIRNVSNLVIKQTALSWSPRNVNLENHPGISITIENSTVNEISSYGVQGRINNIVIRNSKLTNLNSFAFSSLTGVSNVELINNEFSNLGIQVFKTFTTNNFILRGGSIKTVRSTFLSNVEVTNLFTVEAVTMPYIYSSTFIVVSPQRVIIESNSIGVLEGDGFRIRTTGPITFRNNTVEVMNKGALFSLSADTNRRGVQQLLIDNNTVARLSPESLMFNRTTLTMVVEGLNINTSCSCELVEKWQELLNQQGGSINCWDTLVETYVSLPTYANNRCGKFKQTFWIFVGVGILIILVIAVVGVYFIVKREQDRRKKVQIVMPDGKTYKETEFHIVVERADLLTTDF